MAGIIYQFHPDYYQKWNKHSLLIITDLSEYKEFICSPNYCIAKHNNFCKDLPNCRYHILLCFEEDNSSKVFEELKHLHFKYTSVNDLYGFYLHFIHDNLVDSKGDVTVSLYRAIEYFKKYPTFLHQPSVLKKKVARKAFKYHSKAAIVRSTSTQTIEEQLQRRIATIIDSRYCLDFYKIVDALCDHHGNFDSQYIHFCLKK